MVQIINPYKSGGGMGEDIFGLGGLADTFFGPKASQAAYTREKFKEAQRNNEFMPQYASAMAAGGDPGQIAQLGIMAGATGQDVGNYGRYVTVNRNPNALESGPVTAAILGAGGAASSTPQYTAANIQKQYDLDLEKTKRVLAAQQAKDDSELVTVHDSTNPLGYSSVPKSTILTAPIGTYTPVASSDLNKSAQASRMLFPAAGASPVPAVSDDQRKYLGAYTDKSGNNFFVTNALGEVVDQGISEDNGRTKVDGSPVVLKAGEKLQLVSPANPTAVSALGTPGAAVKDIKDSRIATQTAVAQIDNVTTALEQPNANAALGIVGQGAVLINNLRSQVDALTGTARELGYGAHADAFSKGAESYLAKNPGLLQWAQARGIDTGVLKSQLSSLAYVIARANNQQGGALGVRDVEDAMNEIGGNMHDPKALSAVLGNVKTRLLQQQKIKEEVTSGTVSAATRNALKLPGSAAPPATAGPAPPPGFVPD